MEISTEKIEGCNSLSDLGKLVEKCERCPLFKYKNSDVFGEGNSKAEVMFIGEAPGREEDMEGRPFIGKAGKILSEMLAEIGLNRQNIYIANVLKHRPPQNRDPFSEEAIACWPYLKRQIELINPKLIVFLGRHAMNRFFPTLLISRVHGRAFRKSFDGRKQVFLALYHPAVTIYNNKMRETLFNEFKRIPKIIEKIKNEEALKPLKQEKLF